MHFLFHIANQSHTTQIKSLVCGYFPDAKILSIEMLKAENKLSASEKNYIFIDDNNFSDFSAEKMLKGINNKNIQLIMVSESAKYAIDCIRHGFYDYLLINTLKKDFELFSDRIKGQQIIDKKLSAKNHILIKDHKSETKLQYSDILFIEAHGSYSNIYTNNKFFTVTKTIKTLIPNFPETFVRVHRSFAINIVHVKSYSNEEVIMNNETRIKISRSKKMNLIEALEQTA